MSITSVVSLAAGRIGELLLEEAKFLYGVEDEVRSLQDELIMMQSFLIDMEAMDEEEGDERSRTTIKQIRKIAYDAEDLIESYILEASNSPAEGIFGRYLCCCTSLPRTHQIGSDIIAINARIGETMKRWKKYLGENGIGRITYARQVLNKRNRLGIRPIAYSHTIEDHVVGLDEDINKLIGVLTSDDEDTKSIEVVSFVGMGGSGKTTLARKLYNHETIKRHFDCVAWMSISQQWVVKQILLDLLKKVGGESTRDDDFSSHELVEKLHCCLERKRFLIVLDDVWTKQALEEILPAFPLRNDGKKLIVTTRNQNVADFPDVKSFIHEPRRLTEEESWELFRKIALIHRGSSSSSILDEIPVLEALGKEMLKKCQGLPLAVIALAGILGKKETIEEWEKMKKTVSSRIMEDGCGTHLYGPVNKMLMLSYYDLPRELKPCFLYLAMFPEDYEIPTGQLIRMWIAEGFIKPNEEDTVEDVARSYLDELIHRCVVQIATRNYNGKVNRIRVHDLVRDLCIKKTNEEDFLQIFTTNSTNSDSIVTESRRVAVYSSDRRLTEEESWELFRKIALIHRGSSSSPILDEIPVLEALGKEMLKKCQGLPLAVIALAGILGKKETIEEWEKMKKTVSSRIMEDGCGTHLYGPVNKMLMLSYYDLPRELKPCFLYLAMFPEDYEIPTGQLIRMWIAEGFIKPNEEDTVEDVARSYLDELIHRCVVQIATRNYNGKVNRIRVHDLVRDLCIKKTNEEDFLQIFTTNSTNSDSIVTESRRVAVYSSDRVTLPFPTNCQHLRSLVYVAELDPGSPLPDIQKDFRLLRVLMIEGISVSDGILPAAIGRLIHLRYLHLLNTNITELPSSIGSLRKLSTLQYGDVIFSNSYDFTIPDVIWKMEGLRHLYLPNIGSMKQPLNKFHTLKHLQTLSNVQGGDWMLKELPRLSQSVRKLIIRGITSEKQLQIALECPSIKFDRLHSLELRWNSIAENQKQPELTVKQEVLESILHCQRLRKLSLTGRMAGGGRIQLPASINSLDLSETRFEEEAMLVALGKLPYLTDLLLLDNSYMGNRWTCSDGQFLRLKQLYVYGLPKLEEWSIERGAMPQLITLCISRCEELRRIPEGLKFITSLQVLKLSNVEFGERVKGEDAHIIQHVPLVTIV